MIAALNYVPFPLYLAERAEPERKRRPLVVVQEQRVLHANVSAKRHGVTLGMRLDGARMRVEGLQVVSFTEPDLEHAWSVLLRELHDLTPWLEAGVRGRAFAQLNAEEALALAKRHGVPVGLADDRETAELASLTARPGEVREVTAFATNAFLERLPLRFLTGVGLSEANLTRLRWLGLSTAGDLARWSAPQLRSYLAAEGAALQAYLHGPRHAELRPYQLPETLRRSLSFTEPVQEPHQLLPALDRLASALELALAGRSARHLTLTATTAGGKRRASRLAKRPLQQARHISQQALFALHDSQAEGRPIERLTLELTAPSRVGEQEGLWPQRERRQQALRATMERFPATQRRFVWRDPHAQAADLAWGWETYVDESGSYATAAVNEREGSSLAVNKATSRNRQAQSAAASANAVPLFAPEPLNPSEPSTRSAPASTVRQAPVKHVAQAVT